MNTTLHPYTISSPKSTGSGGSSCEEPAKVDAGDPSRVVVDLTTDWTSVRNALSAHNGCYDVAALIVRGIAEGQLNESLLSEGH